MGSQRREINTGVTGYIFDGRKQHFGPRVSDLAMFCKIGEEGIIIGETG